MWTKTNRENNKYLDILENGSDLMVINSDLMKSWIPGVHVMSRQSAQNLVTRLERTKHEIQMSFLQLSLFFVLAKSGYDRYHGEHLIDTLFEKT